MAVLTSLEKLNIGRLSAAFASVDIIKQGLYGGGTDLQLPTKISFVQQSIQWLYDLDNTDSTLFDTTNYLYALCGKYKFDAEKAISGGSGGGIVPVTPAGTTGFLEFIVTASTPIPTGSDTYLFNAAPYDWRGFELQFNRGNQPMGRIDNGSQYYSWNKINGAFQMFGAASAGEDLMFYITV